MNYSAHNVVFEMNFTLKNVTAKEMAWAFFGAIFGFFAFSFVGLFACGYAMIISSRLARRNLGKSKVISDAVISFIPLWEFAFASFMICVIGIMHAYAWGIACDDVIVSCQVLSFYWYLVIPPEASYFIESVRLYFFNYHPLEVLINSGWSPLNMERLYVFTLVFMPASAVYCCIVHWKNSFTYVSMVINLIIRRKQSFNKVNISTNFTRWDILRHSYFLVIGLSLFTLLFFWISLETMVVYSGIERGIGEKIKSTAQSMRFDPVAIIFIYGFSFSISFFLWLIVNIIMAFAFGREKKEKVL